jgi:integrating conjugative element protein (TIGR03759 family)
MQIHTFLIVICLFLAGTAAAEQQTDYQVEDFKVDELKVDKGYLDAWGITKEEYKRFVYLKRNTPRGVITPQANPLYYLGLEARTPQERRRFAEKVAQMEFENVEKGREWRAEVQLAAARMYGKPDVVDLSIGEKLNERIEAETRGMGSNSPASSLFGDVKLLFVDFNCADCEVAYTRAMAELVSGSLKRLEVVFKRGSSDIEIKKWAMKVGVPIELNKRGVVELRQAANDEKVDKYPTVRFGSA